jgi:hypothetical protein
MAQVAVVGWVATAVAAGVVAVGATTVAVVTASVAVARALAWVETAVGMAMVLAGGVLVGVTAVRLQANSGSAAKQISKNSFRVMGHASKMITGAGTIR